MGLLLHLISRVVTVITVTFSTDQLAVLTVTVIPASTPAQASVTVSVHTQFSSFGKLTCVKSSSCITPKVLEIKVFKKAAATATQSKM